MVVAVCVGWWYLVAVVVELIELLSCSVCKGATGCFKACLLV